MMGFDFSGERGPGCAAQEMIEVDPQELKEKRERENRKKLTGLLEKIEGCSVSFSSILLFLLSHFLKYCNSSTVLSFASNCINFYMTFLIESV